ncbi:MAG: PhzF family phenazine biosynthesis protein [Acidobacteriota bacterium]|nr:PhzF family phenazine biosynthesis protein [Acidobacteriota bacterium]
MRTYGFYQLDVFTEQRFAGNALAVFPDGAGISDEEMQQIAREMNLSETVFVLPSDEPEALKRLRIFTPTKELPLAGHPVVGTWNLLARLGFVENAPADGAIQIKQELGVGVLPVEIEFKRGEPQKVTMTQDRFSPGEIITGENLRNAIAEAFNLASDDLQPDAPIQVCGTGVNFTIIPVRSLAALKNSRANTAKLEELPRTLPGEFSLFCWETLEETSLIHTRMYAPEFGITEDPATGSAAGTLGGYIVHHGLFAQELKRNDGVLSFTIEQGDFIERPSRIHVEVTGEKGNVQRVRVGGASVIVAKGEIYL